MARASSPPGPTRSSGSPCGHTFRRTEEAAGAASTSRCRDGGHRWPLLTEFSFQGGSNHFNDKPMITVDQGAASPFRDHVYVAWDAAFGGSSAGGIRVAHSADHGASFVTNRADNPSGPGRSIGAAPFVGPDGTLAVAWNDVP